MEYFQDREAVLAIRRKNLAEIAASYTVATVAPVAAVVAAPVAAPVPQPDQTQSLADLMVKLEEKTETVDALVALLGDVTQANMDLESECKKHQADLASLLDMIFHSNPATVVPPAQRRPLAIMDRQRVRFCEPIEPFVPRFDSSEFSV
jgi:hypothetical protein